MTQRPGIIERIRTALAKNGIANLKIVDDPFVDRSIVSAAERAIKRGDFASARKLLPRWGTSAKTNPDYIQAKLLCAIAHSDDGATPQDVRYSIEPLSAAVEGAASMARLDRKRFGPLLEKVASKTAEILAAIAKKVEGSGATIAIRPIVEVALKDLPVKSTTRSTLLQTLSQITDSYGDGRRNLRLAAAESELALGNFSEGRRLIAEEILDAGSSAFSGYSERDPLVNAVTQFVESFSAPDASITGSDELESTLNVTGKVAKMLEWGPAKCAGPTASLLQTLRDPAFLGGLFGETRSARSGLFEGRVADALETISRQLESINAAADHYAASQVATKQVGAYR